MKSYWTEIGLAAREALQSQKIYDAKLHHKRHPKLSDLTFKKKEVTPLPELSREERRKQFEEQRKNKAEKLANLPYSDLHNKLVNNLYSKRVDAIKKSALEAAHEATIERIMIKRSIQASMKAFTNDKNKPNLLIVNREYEWNISPFMTIPSSHTIDTLRKIANDMASKLSISMKDFFNIEIWERSEYMKKLAGDRFTNYRYTIGKTKSAA